MLIPHRFWWLPLGYKRCIFPPTIIYLRSDTPCIEPPVGVLGSDVLMYWPQEKPVREKEKQNMAGIGPGLEGSCLFQGYSHEACFRIGFLKADPEKCYYFASVLLRR